MMTEKQIPTEEEISELLNQLQPHPGPRFHQRMSKQPWNRTPGLLFGGRFTALRAAATLGLVVLFIFGFSLFSPTLETLAQRLSQFFWSQPEQTVTAEIDPLEITDPLDRFCLDISEAEVLAGFKMKTPASLQEGFSLTGAAYDELREAIILNYTAASGGLVLRISQQYPGDDYQSVGPQAVVEMVSVGPHMGEYVAGGWKIPVPEVESGASTTTNPGISQLVWDPNVKLQSLRWSDGEFLYEIILAGGANQPGYLHKEDLIDLATGLQ